MLLVRACLVAAVLVLVVVADLGAAAEADLSSQIEANIEALADPDPEVREEAAHILGRIGPAAEPAVPALITALADAEPQVRQNAASALGWIGSAVAPAVPALIEALADPDPQVRWRVAWTLGRIGPAAAPAVPALIEVLPDPEPPVREKAAGALAQIGPAAAPAVDTLTEALADPDPQVREEAAWALGRIGPAAVPALIEALADPDPEARQGAAWALGRIGPAAVPALIEALADPEARQGAAGALAQIGPAAAPAVETLIEALADPDPQVREEAAWALGRIGPAAVEALIEALARPDPPVREVVRALGWSREVVGLAAPRAFGELSLERLEPEVKVEERAAPILGRIGPAAEPALPVLIKALADPEPQVQRNAAWVLVWIASSLRDARAIGALGTLRQAQAALETHPDSDVSRRAAPVARAVEDLERQRWENMRKEAIDLIKGHPYLVSMVVAVPAWLVVCFGLLWLRPVALLKINDALRSLDVTLPDKLGGMTVSLRRRLLIGALSHRPRVLDAWVSRHAPKARENFERKRTVEERSVHIPMPVHLDKADVAELKGEDLRAVFAAGRGPLLIWGEGGSGKTSIACRIARWAMADKPEERPARHRMLPVLIERELDFAVAEGRDPFTETVRGDLEKLIGARIDDELLAALLEQRRVLVIVDHLSEMTELTRQRVRPDAPDFPAAALIVTSRLEERLGDVPKSALRPLRVTGDYLFEFMSAYLKARSVRELFPDREFGHAGARIAELVGERDVTVLLVKLYLDRLIETKERGGDIDEEMPASIPSLMLQYLNDVNRAVPQDIRREERAVHRDAAAVAWACLEERLRPASAPIDEAARALLAVYPEEVKERLDYLERRLLLIETLEPERDRVRFALDPVAEYLAARHIVGCYRGDAQAWREFLAQADAMPGGLEAIQGFLLAVRDCCLARKEEVPVPNFVPDELAKRAVLELDRLRQARPQEPVALSG